MAGLRACVASVPPGRWAVGVSGGADSVALLLLLHDRHDLSLHVVHLDHETRGGVSTEDASFVRDLAVRLSLACTVETLSTVESGSTRVQHNRAARFREARFALFRRVVDEHDLDGVILAHHADDQAETVMHRILRGSGAAGVAGMSPSAPVAGLRVLRPLLGVRRDELRAVLTERGQGWREDTSNASDVYLRNRVRRVLERRAELTNALLGLGEACGRFRTWLRVNTPAPGTLLGAGELLGLPTPLRREFAGRWLAAAGVPRDRIDAKVVRQLVEMLEDAASPPRQHFPGNVLVRRTRGTLTAHRET
jgi:tRNA(Ile)-lysidine synthetase-like protein